VLILITGPIEGTGINPARWFGPALANGDLSNAAVWIVGPIAGALLAAFIYDAVVKPSK
jgi:glycerol uptake facilitator protein